ncbi:MAG: transporter [Longimicrobiales bacterium]|nr:transporter [Longimicrobiales bacterium]
MQELLDQLFVFSGGQEPLFLVGSAGQPATEVHGNHFIPSEAATNGVLLDIFTGAIASNISNFPLSSTVSSQTFTFVEGVPVPTSSSFGPIFAERAQTLGRGRFDVGFSYTSLGFERLRGAPMEALELTFLHENVDFPNCDVIFDGDCSQFGFPSWEQDRINLDLDLDIRAEIYAFTAVFGVTDWLDLGVAVPVVQIGIDGMSVATVSPAVIDDVPHFFGGTAESPELSANSFVDGSATGIGDVAARAKFKFLDSETLGLAVLGEVRLPTGREEDFLGTGSVQSSGLLIASATYDAFSPHVNFGYSVKEEAVGPDAFTFAAGFDQRLSEWATFIADVLGEVQMGDSAEFPESATYEWPTERTVGLTNIPNRRDDVISGALGFKFRTQSGIVLWTNALVALNDGGMRDRLAATFGFQWATR